ncbi:hypothetical protein LguiA_026347 [Lonicera macranthoides]
MAESFKPQNFVVLRHLSITDCPSLTSLPAGSMMHLTSLEALWIIKCEKLNLEKTMELPGSLLSLALSEIPKLKELPRGFKNASQTLKYMNIHGCPSFEILPDWLKKCNSLLRLNLYNCKRLESLPLGMTHQLTALQELHIVNCSEELNRKCDRETGKYWLGYLIFLQLSIGLTLIQMFSVLSSHPESIQKWTRYIFVTSSLFLI